MAATAGNPVEKYCGVIAMSQTLGTGYNLFITLGLIVTLPFLTRLMLPRPEEVREIAGTLKPHGLTTYDLTVTTCLPL